MSIHSIYLEEGKKTLDVIDPSQIARVADILWQARNEERTVFIFGNGGSAALAVHFAGDLAECVGKAAPSVAKRLHVQCLAENLTTLLAIANDLSYEEIFYATRRRRSHSCNAYVDERYSGEDGGRRKKSELRTISSLKFYQSQF